METLKIKIVNKSNNELPKMATAGAAGMDIKAFIENPITLKPGERKLIPTGLFMAIPEGYEAQVRPRSGLALKYGITVLNAPGTIDSDYRGEVGIILYNASDKEFVVESGERIAQLVISNYTKSEFIPVDVLDETERGEGGFGHTGIK